MPTIDHLDGGQTYVNTTAEGKVRVEHAERPAQEATDDLDARSARARAVELRAEADALDSAADHVLANHLDHTVAIVERLLVPAAPDVDAVRAALANVRGLLDEAMTGESYEPATLPTPALEAAPTIT